MHDGDIEVKEFFKKFRFHLACVSVLATFMLLAFIGLAPELKLYGLSNWLILGLIGLLFVPTILIFLIMNRRLIEGLIEQKSEAVYKENFLRLLYKRKDSTNARPND